jgi:hypothetical protein
MKIPRPAWVLARLCFVGFVLLTSTYCLLNYIPFTYHQVNVGGLLPSITMFVRIHAYLYWPALAIVAPTLIPEQSGRRARVLAQAFFLFFACFGVVLLIRPLLPRLRNDSWSLFWSLVVLAPLPWVAAIDWLRDSSRLVWRTSGTGEDRRIFAAAWQCALFLSLLYAVICYVASALSNAGQFGPRVRLVALVWSLGYHLVTFMGIFVVVSMSRAVASLFDEASKVEFLLLNVLAFLLVRQIVVSVVFPQISFGGTWANVFSTVLAFCLVAFNAGMAARLYRPEEGPVDSGLALFLVPVTFGHLARWWWKILAMVLISTCAGVLAVKLAVFDWNYLLQKLSVMGVWIVSFAAFYAMARGGKSREGLVVMWLLVAAATLGAYKGLEASEPRWKGLLGGQQREVAGVMESYAGRDISFKLIRDGLAPSHKGDLFYRFLSENTNIPQSTRVDPVQVELAQNLAPGAAPKPHIFIFVIDSLRRDYLSPYNSSVTFTPSIDAFARESVVMENAFTQYGGTGLSEPSIWVGGMIIHKQYVTPFYPMNALQKLIQAENYQSYVSKDSILSVIMGPSSSLVELDEDIGSMSYDFCRTLKELAEKIGQRKDSARPIFAYTQPQNIHISVINREGHSVPAGESYPGFYAPYASRIRRMDRCFGEFIQFLRTSALYQQSVIILTADHGDSLGEDGRWGHAYTIFPEILRIPLIIHLPPDLRASLSVDPRAVSFLTDITPSLYYVLGQKPILRNGIFGRPLFTRTPEEQAPYVRDSYLVTSSYGPVYGILKDNGRTLFIVDGVNYQEYLYQSTKSALDTTVPVTAPVRTQYEELIRSDILAINRFYKFGGQQ